MAVTGRIREWSVVPAVRSIRRLVITAIALTAIGGWLIWRQLQGRNCRPTVWKLAHWCSA